MKAKLLDDLDLVTTTMRHRRIWPSISDDGSPAREAFQASPSLTYLGMFEGHEYLGLFVLHQHNAIMWEVHTCLLPSAWGSRAQACAKLCVEWIFDNTECRRLITSVPVGNALAERLAGAAGMVRYGTNPRSFLKNGQELDQIMLGISKGATCQPQQ
mgnify:CR=1 FL=1